VIIYDTTTVIMIMDWYSASPQEASTEVKSTAMDDTGWGLINASLSTKRMRMLNRLMNWVYSQVRENVVPW